MFCDHDSPHNLLTGSRFKTLYITFAATFAVKPKYLYVCIHQNTLISLDSCLSESKSCLDISLLLGTKVSGYFTSYSRLESKCDREVHTIAVLHFKVLK